MQAQLHKMGPNSPNKKKVAPHLRVPGVGPGWGDGAWEAATLRGVCKASFCREGSEVLREKRKEKVLCPPCCV